MLKLSTLSLDIEAPAFISTTIHWSTSRQRRHLLQIGMGNRRSECGQRPARAGVTMSDREADMNVRDPNFTDGLSADIAARVAAIQWPQVKAELDAFGAACVPHVLAPEECRALSALYGADDRVFRSRVVMARHGFGQGEYRYFRYPLPALIDALRSAVYPYLVPLANRWHESMELSTR